jgi:membrane associated rhomboid family serine protease
MPNDSQTIRQELSRIGAFIAAIWAVFALSLLFPAIDRFGVTPRTLTGLTGIVAMPFLHADLDHIVGNTVPLFILLCLLAGSKARSWEIVVDVVLLGGTLLWIFGRPATHIGASGLIFGLIAFLLVSGFLERRFIPLAAALAVGFLYGSTLLSGVWPRLGSNISWDGHLTSAIAGGIVAYVLTRDAAAHQRLADKPTALLESTSHES